MGYSKDSVGNIKKVIRFINEGHISSAIELLAQVLVGLREYKMLEFVNELKNSYKYLLEYALTGGEDRGRNIMLSDIRESLLGIAEEILSNIETVSDPAIFYSNRRFDKMQKENLSMLLERLQSIESENSLVKETGVYSEDIAKKREELVDNIFDKVMALPFHAMNDLKHISRYILSEERSEDVKKILISALFISVSQQYNRYKVISLIDIYENTNNEKIAARALVSLLIIFNKFSDRISRDLVIGQRLELWKDSLVNYTRLRDTVMAFLRTMDTTRINDKMKKDLIPGLSKLKPEIVKEFSKNFKPEDLDEMEFNPEWEEMLRQSGLDKKLKEFAELQSEGADIMMIPFSQLKQFSFFHKLSHWFLPFSSDYSQLGVLRSLNNEFFDKMLEVGPFCDSDKFSFALSLNQMPKEQVDIIKMQMAGGLEQMKLEHEEINLKLKNPGFLSELDNYMKNLYRFFNLFRKKDEFDNPLSSPLAFTELPYIGDWLKEQELVSLAAEFFFKRKYFQHSLTLFQIVADNEPTEIIWDKIGFCQQSLHRFKDALESYEKAEMFGQFNSWRLKMKAGCYKMLGDYECASDNYSKLLESDPDNKSLLYNIAICEMVKGNYRSVIEKCYKYDYLYPGNIKILQLLSLSEAYDGNYSKAKSIVDKMIIEHGIDSDINNYFVLGTLSLRNGDMRDAIKMYRMISKDSQQWYSIVHKEMEALGLWDINKEKILMMREYDLLES